MTQTTNVITDRNAFVLSIRAKLQTRTFSKLPLILFWTLSHRKDNEDKVTEIC